MLYEEDNAVKSKNELNQFFQKTEQPLDIVKDIEKKLRVFEKVKESLIQQGIGEDMLKEIDQKIEAQQEEKKQYNNELF